MQNDGQGVSYKKKKIAYFLRNIYMFSTWCFLCMRVELDRVCM